MLDQMTAVERFTALAKGERVDRLPCIPIMGNGAARVIGIKVSDFRGNGKRMAEAHVGAYRRFGYDIIRIFTDLYQQAEAMGAQVFYPEDQTAHLQTPAITSLQEIDAMMHAVRKWST
ncbi:MAG: hypothetical protein KGZ63_04350 [Clostridiales bacterium]|nr:hypothetical protein [Clostridiales bacterium]